jgi:multidrug transporter EmrE-like cation transporter
VKGEYKQAYSLMVKWTVCMMMISDGFDKNVPSLVSLVYLISSVSLLQEELFCE